MLWKTNMDSLAHSHGVSSVGWINSCSFNEAADHPCEEQQENYEFNVQLIIAEFEQLILLHTFEDFSLNPLPALSNEILIEICPS